MEQEIMELITYGGEARSLALSAMKKISLYKFSEAEELLRESSKSILKAHKVQTKLLSLEANGEMPEVKLLMVHAQDHLMDAMVIRDITEQMLVIQKNNYELLKYK